MIGAFKHMGRILPKLWNDRVTIKGVIGVKKGVFSDSKDATIVENYPAKVVLGGQKTSEQSFFGTDQYDAKLLIDNSVFIPAGADVYVTDVNGHKTKYKRASKGYQGYASHQEVAMVRDEKAKDVVNDGMGNN
ncbi:hypothetical protein [Companilactobacillus hulinensis]|uniref:hypothetical protein n=1 Tax=Companilactobacillus hulinensis TaxID=2486007 RepID=UPI001CDC89CE|nr:hypothetical protein [Companilactobacillus hulinensis]